MRMISFKKPPRSGEYCQVGGGTGESWGPSQCRPGISHNYRSPSQSPGSQCHSATVSHQRWWINSHFFSWWVEPSLKINSTEPSLMTVVRLYACSNLLTGLFQDHCWILPLHYRAQCKWLLLSTSVLDDMFLERFRLIKLDSLRGGGLYFISFFIEGHIWGPFSTFILDVLFCLYVAM